MGENRVIGNNGALPWRLSSDLKRFRELTLGKPVVMGRRTFESIGKPLDGRQNVVVTQVSKLCQHGVWTVPDMEEAILFGNNLCEEMGADEVMIIGGEQIFKALLPPGELPKVDRIYLTRVQGSPAGDTYFPDLEPEHWTETALCQFSAGEKDDFDCSQVLLERCC